VEAAFLEGDLSRVSAELAPFEPRALVDRWIAGEAGRLGLLEDR
jgi:hypothetical protein